MALKIATETLDELDYEGLVLGFFSNERPPRGRCGFVDWRLNGLISRYLKEDKIRGDYLEKVLIPTHERIPTARILLIGLGRSDEITYDQLYTAGYTISETIAGMGWGELAIDIPAAGRCSLEVPIMTEAVITGYMDYGIEGGRLSSRLSTDLLIDPSGLEDARKGLERFRRNAGKTMNLEVEP